jgi:hypothetical protein
MSYLPIPASRVPSGIVFFGADVDDKVLDGNASFTIDTAGASLQIPNGGYIGSQDDNDSIQIASNGNVTMSQSLSITGNLTVNGTTTTVNSTTVTIDDPIFTLGGDTAPGSDDNKDRGISFNWHNGVAAKTGFFGFDDSTGKFTFVPDAAISNEVVVSGAAGTIVANLEGNVTGDLTGTADDADGLSSSVTVSLGGELSGSSTFQNAGDTCSITASLDTSAIDGQTELSSAPDATNDYILIYDASATALKKINRTNFVSGLGAMSSFDISDGSTTQTIQDGNTLTFVDGTNIDVAVSATGLVTVGISDAGLNSIASLTTAADKMIYTTASDTYAVTDLTSFGRSLIDDADASAARTTLGVDAAGTDNSTDVTLNAALTDVLSLSTQELSAVDNGSDAVVGWDDSAGKLTYLSAADVRTAINVDVAGTDNSTDVTLAAGRDYLTISGQEITLGLIDISDDTNLAVDSTTITLTGDTLSVTTGGIDTDQLAAGAVTEAKIERTVDSSFADNDTIGSDINLVAGGSGGITVKLPAPASGKLVIVKKTDSAAGAVTVARNSSESIDGANSVALYYQYESFTFVSDGTNWFVV